MIISEDRQSHLAHLITDGIYHDDLADYTDDRAALNAVKAGVIDFVRLHEELDAKVTKMIRSLQRSVVEDSPEWEIMYQKYYEQELKRRGQN